MSLTEMDFKVVTFNIANATTDELSENYCFGKRINDVIREIKKADGDIVCIQELRECLSADGSEILTPVKIALILSLELNMAIASLDRVGVTELSFWRLTLYNQNKLFHLSSELFWINKEGEHTLPRTPLKWGNLAVRSTFAPFTLIIRGKTPETTENLCFSPEKIFSVVNTHFPLGKSHRMKTAEFVRDLSQKGTFQLVVGDMNTFYDDGGQNMIDIMSSGGYTDLLPDEPTFSSFPHDKVQTTSRLDHMLCKGEYIHISSKVYNNTNYNVRPSDHFMCETVVKF